MTRTAVFICATAIVALGGCTQRTPQLYHWGSYERLLYDTHASPGKADPGTQVAKLTEDIGRAEGTGSHVPPGVHAHLGYLYYTQGQPDLAAEQFLIERELFPESAVFIDGIVARMTR